MSRLLLLLLLIILLLLLLILLLLLFFFFLLPFSFLIKGTGPFTFDDLQYSTAQQREDAASMWKALKNF